MPKTQVTPCTKEEIDSLLDASIDDDFYYMLFYVAKTTGRRLGEFYGVYKREDVGIEEFTNKFGETKKRIKKRKTSILEGGVQVKDIDFERKIMLTYILKRRRRVLSEAVLTDEAVRIIKQYIAAHKLKLDDYLFRKRTMRAIQLAVVRYAKLAKIPHKVCFHNFRHYLITHLTKKGWSYNQIIKITGHGSTASLGSYDHSVASDFKDKVLEDIKDL